MSRDSNRFKLDPTIVALNSQTAGQNYGHVISQAFKDLGDIENNKINLQLADTKNQYEEIKLNSIKDELDDDKIFNSYLLSDDKNEFLKNNKFKTSKYSLMGEDYKNSLSLKEQEGHVKSALTMFSDDKGNFNRNEAFGHLSKKFKEGVISEKQLYDIADSIDQRTQSGIYTPKTSMKDQLDMIKTQAEIRKINNDIANPRGAEYAPTSEMKNYEAYAKSMKNSGMSPKAYHEWIDDNNLNKNMGMGVKDINYANSAVVQALNSENKSERIQAANIYSNIIKDAKEVDKYFRGLAPTTYQLNEAQKIVEKGGAGVSDEIKNQFSVWTGLAWDDTTQEGRTAFLSVLQPLAKATMTGSQSDRDMKTLENSFSNLYKSDKALANALKNKTEQLLYTAEQYEQRHPDYVRLTGYDKNINLLRTILNSGEKETTGTKILIDKTTDSQPISKDANTNKPSWKDYE